MIHHLSVGTNDIASARRFYDAIMPVLGMRLLNGSAGSADYGAASFLFSVETRVDDKPAMPGNGVQVAFAAGRRPRPGWQQDRGGRLFEHIRHQPAAKDGPLTSACPSGDYKHDKPIKTADFDQL
jgi:catechol 2,3-dioxygenase-like lactoylglutathione lyase family enzyme